MLLPSPLHHAILSCWFYSIFRLGNSSTWHCPRNPVYSACLYRLVPIFRSNLSELVLLRSYQLLFFTDPDDNHQWLHLYSLTFEMLLYFRLYCKLTLSHALHNNKRRKILRENSLYIRISLFFFFLFSSSRWKWQELSRFGCSLWQIFSIANSFFCCCWHEFVI